MQVRQQARWAPYLEQVAGRGFDRRHRHVGHDPQPRHDGGRATTGERAGRRPQPARAGEGDAPAAQAAGRRPTSPSGCASRAWIRGAPTSRSPARCSSTPSCAGWAPTSSRSATSRCAKDWCSTTSGATAPRIRKVERYPDVRRRSIIELGERCGYWPEHAQQVARLALNIFDQTRERARSEPTREREWLEYGALLHDVGVHISYERHHRHSYYLIKNGDLRGFAPAGDRGHGAHRPLSPAGDAEEERTTGYGDLRGSLRRTVRALSAMVRLAEGLDRSHAQALSGLDLYPRGDDYLVRLRTAGDAELELWAAAPPRRAAARRCSASRCASRSRPARPRRAPVNGSDGKRGRAGAWQAGQGQEGPAPSQIRRPGADVIAALHGFYAAKLARNHRAIPLWTGMPLLQPVPRRRSR